MGTDAVAFFPAVFSARALHCARGKRGEKKEENRGSIMARRAVIHPRLTTVCRANRTAPRYSRVIINEE